MYSFLLENSYAQSHVQKGFIPGLSGTFEHIAAMSHIISQARVKHRSLTITLLDLKNAFGEVSHDLIKCVFDYHHIPKEISEIFDSLYSNFGTAIATNTFVTGLYQ